MAKITIEVDTDTKQVTATVGSSIIDNINYVSIYKYSDCCEVCFEKTTNQDGMKVSKTYRACAAKGQSLVIKEDDKKTLESATAYFKKVIK